MIISHSIKIFHADEISAFIAWEFAIDQINDSFATSKKRRRTSKVVSFEVEGEETERGACPILVAQTFSAFETPLVATTPCRSVQKRHMNGAGRLKFVDGHNRVRTYR
jgi:hypothetical protein